MRGSTKEYPYGKTRIRNRRNNGKPFKACIRATKLCVLCVLIPIILLTVPLYLRYHVYKQQIYPVGVSDMRLLDNKISTLWCQKQTIDANATFNAFVLPEDPIIKAHTTSINLKRSILLKDSSKEYWGFYLLQGSSFRISSCVRWPGATLIVIEGHKNLKECAYISDNSSEGQEDDMESSEEDKNINVMEKMTKILPGIILEYDRNETNDYNITDIKSLMDNSKKFLKPSITPKKHNVHLKYAEDLYKIENEQDGVIVKPVVPTFNMSKPIKSKQQKLTHEKFEDILEKLDILGAEGELVLKQLYEYIAEERDKAKITDGGDLQNDNDKKKIISNDNLYGSYNKSSVVKLQMERILEILENADRLKGQMNNNMKERQVKNQQLTEETTTARQMNGFDKLKKQLLMLRMQGNEDNVGDDSNAAEEVTDEPVDIHGIVNSTNNGDRSKSEFWSSFSSSEERLLKCKGLLVSLPLIPHKTCGHQYSMQQMEKSSRLNSVYYKVMNDGYYFFVFNNENEVKDNFIHMQFYINKTMYDTSKATVTLKNQTNACSLPLSFWSNERTVFELPIQAFEESIWNEEFIVISTCEPRMTVYLACFILVPVFIALFASSD